MALDVLGPGIGIARYEVQQIKMSAEIAIAVAPDWRRMGLGSTLLRMLGEAAVVRGFRQLVALYFVGNRDVEGLVKACGLRMARPGVSRGRRGTARPASHLASSGPPRCGRSAAGVEVVDHLGVVLVDDGSLDLHRRGELAGSPSAHGRAPGTCGCSRHGTGGR